MTIRHIYRLLLCVGFFMAAMQMSAQDLTAVSGTVSDNIEPLIGVSVCEVDGNDRIINATVTDINGHFTMKIKDTKNKIRFSYVGCKTQTLPINRKVYDIILRVLVDKQPYNVAANETGAAGDYDGSFHGLIERDFSTSLEMTRNYDSIISSPQIPS